MRYFFLYIGFSVITLVGFSQTSPCDQVIEGTIYDLSTKEPLQFANVQIKGTTIGATTDEKGHFIIQNVCKEDFDLVFSFIGYKQFIHHHDSYHDLPDIYLAPDDLMLDGIVIESQAVYDDVASLAVSEISGKELEQLHANGFGDLASEITGVNLLTTGQVAKPMIHGLHSSRVLIVNDNVRHEFQNWGKEHAPEIDPSMVDHLEVIKGAATVRYGPDALGGVILISPEPLQAEQKLTGKVSLTSKSNGRGGEGVLKLSKGSHNFAWRLGAFGSKYGDLSSKNYILSNTGQGEYGANLGLLFHKNKFDLEADLNYIQQEMGILRGSVVGNLEDLAKAISADEPFYTSDFTYDINTPRQFVKHTVAKLKASYFIENGKIEAQYAFQNNHRQEFDVRKGINNELPSIDLILSTHTFDFNFIKANPWKGTHSIGAQWMFQNNENQSGTNTISFIPNYTIQRLGIYGIESIQIANKQTLEAGIRVDYQKNWVIGRTISNVLFYDDADYLNMTATIGYLKEWNHHASFRSNLGTAWRPPSMSELYIFGKHQASLEYGLFRYDLSPNNQFVAGDFYDSGKGQITPERGVKWINSVERKSGNHSIAITAYAQWIDHFFYSRPAGVTETVRGAFPFFVYDQTTAGLSGIDFDWRWNKGEQLKGHLSSNVLWAKDLTNNQYFIEMPPFQMRYRQDFFMNWDKFENAGFYIQPEWILKTHNQPPIIDVNSLLTDGSNAFITSKGSVIYDLLDAPAGYVLVDLGFHVEKNRMSLDVQMRNALNTSYRMYTDRLRYFADQTGRNIVLAFKYTL